MISPSVHERLVHEEYVACNRRSTHRAWLSMAMMSMSVCCPYDIERRAEEYDERTTSGCIRRVNVERMYTTSERRTEVHDERTTCEMSDE